MHEQTTLLLGWLPILIFPGAATVLSVTLLALPIVVSRGVGAQKPNTAKLS